MGATLIGTYPTAPTYSRVGVNKDTGNTVYDKVQQQSRVMLDCQVGYLVTQDDMILMKRRHQLRHAVPHSMEVLVATLHTPQTLFIHRQTSSEDHPSPLVHVPFLSLVLHLFLDNLYI